MQAEDAIRSTRGTHFPGTAGKWNGEEDGRRDVALGPERSGAPPGRREGRPPAEAPHSADQVKDRLADSLPQGSPEAVALDLVAMTPGERAAWMAGFEAGHLDRIVREERTYAQTVEDIAREYIRLLALNEELDVILADAIARPAFDELADRRGQHTRAAQARRLWRERGIS